jgi:hypothetical protein
MAEVFAHPWMQGEKPTPEEVFYSFEQRNATV